MRNTICVLLIWITSFAFAQNVQPADTTVSGNVTFRVDMRPLTNIGWFLPAVDTLQVRGEFNSWLGERMTLSPLTGLWNYTRPYTGDALQELKYKYYVKLDAGTASSRFPNWFFYADAVQYEQLFSMGGGGVRAFSLPAVSGNITVGPFLFSEISQENLMLNSTDTCRVTLRVNMGPATRYVDPFNPETDAVFVSWSEYAWALNQSANQGGFALQQRMTRNSPTDSIWSISFRVKGKTHSGMMYVYQFRHATGGGNVIEGGGGGVLNPYRVRYIPRISSNVFPLSYIAPVDQWQKNPPMPVEPPPLTDVREDLTNLSLPKEIVLHQNYPNPFNPSTTISYSVTRTSDVRLGVFNLLGQQVAQLVNEKQSRGNYIARFEPGNLASGVYMYRLEFDGEVITKKMLLIR